LNPDVRPTISAKVPITLSIPLLLATAMLVLAGGVVPAAQADPSPPPYPTSPMGDPPGANDWDCRPSAQRPTPVILVHGTFGDRLHLLEALSSSFKSAGFCVYSLDYGNRGTGDIRDSAEELKVFVGKVRRSTGAATVSMVGHSQGGMMPRYYIKYLGGDRVVEDLVGIAPSNHGTKLVPSENPLADLVPGAICISCVQQAWGSAFLRRLNRGDETPGPTSYTQITTRYDEVVVPHTSGYLEAGPRTMNVTLQDKCPFALAEHLLIPTHKATVAIALNALLRDGPARKDLRPAC
jgi:triacylglycerol esterase/lipase EstA (alpha/beta hydrolase family)